MPRPPHSEEQRDQIRQRIIAAAQDIFDSEGIDGVSMRSVGSRVGLTASALYAYFPSKSELVRALWWDALDELDRNVQDLSRQVADPVEAIRALALAYAQFALENPVRFRVLFMAFGNHLAAELQERDRRSPNTSTYAIFLQRVAEAVEQGRLRITDPELAAQTLWAGIHGVLSLTNAWAGFHFQPPLLLTVTMTDTLLAGMSANPEKE